MNIFPQEIEGVTENTKEDDFPVILFFMCLRNEQQKTLVCTK